MNKRFGLIIDQERCIGCDACTVACRMEHNSEEGFIQVDTQGSELKDDPQGEFPDLRISWLPRLCNHCENPPCSESCPENAINKRKDGVVLIDEDICSGCQMCVDACPYNAISFNDTLSKARKCDLCVNRIDHDLDPFCSLCCEGQAIYFGNFDNPNSRVSKLLKKREHFRLNLELGTEPGIYYLKPMEKRDL